MVLRCAVGRLNLPGHQPQTGEQCAACLLNAACGMEAPTGFEKDSVGNGRRRPAQPAAVLTGSASLPPFPVKPYPLKTSQTPLYAVGVVTTRR